MKIKSVVGLLIVTALFILGAEIICRVFNLGKSAYVQPDSKLGFRLIPGKDVVWNFEGFSHDRISSAGFRDVEHNVAKEPGVRRVLMLGDSFAEALQVPLQDTVARQLQRKCDEAGGAKFEIINASCSAYSLGQMVVLLEELAEVYKPDDVFLLKSNSFNKVLPNFRACDDNTVVERPYFYVENGKLKQDSSLLPDPAYCAAMSWLLKNSCLVECLSYQDFFRSFNDRNYQAVKANCLSSVRSVLSQHIQYDAQNPAEIRTALIAALNSDVQKYGAKLTVFAMPARNAQSCSDDNSEIKNLGKQLKFDVVDLSPSLSKAGPSVFLKHHLSKLGHQILAEQMAAHLLQRSTSVAENAAQTLH